MTKYISYTTIIPILSFFVKSFLYVLKLILVDDKTVSALKRKAILCVLGLKISSISHPSVLDREYCVFVVPTIGWCPFLSLFDPTVRKNNSTEQISVIYFFDTQSSSPIISASVKSLGSLSVWITEVSIPTKDRVLAML